MGTTPFHADENHEGRGKCVESTQSREGGVESLHYSLVKYDWLAQ